MAFLRSSVLMKNVLNSVHRTFKFVAEPIRPSKLLSAYFQSWVSKDNNKILNENKKNCCQISGYATNAKAQPIAVSLSKKLEYLDIFSRRHRYVSRNDIDQLLQTIEKGKINLPQSLTVIKYFGSIMVEEKPETRTRLVQTLWKLLQPREIIDISHYNALLGVYVENEHPFSVDEILADISSRGLTPNRATYQRLIEKCSLTGDFDGIENVVKKLKEQGLALNANIYNSFILAYGIVGEIASAQGVIATMKEAGVEPIHETYVNLLRAYAKSGDLATLKAEIERLKNEDVLLQEQDYLQLVYELVINGHTNQSKELLDTITDKSVDYNRLAVNTITRLLQKDEDDVAFDILISMIPRKNEDGTLTDNGSFYVRQLIKLNRPAENVAAILIKLKETGLHSAPLGTIRSVLDNGQLDLVLFCLRQFKANNIKLNLEDVRPLFTTNASYDAIQLLQVLISELEIKTTYEFIRELLLPKLNLKNPEKIITELLSANVPMPQAALGVACQLLRHGELAKASNILAYFKLYPFEPIFKGPSVHALKVSNDIENFSWFLQIVHENHKPTKSEDTNDRSEILGQWLHYTLEKLDSETRVRTFTAILKNLVNQGLTISTSQAERIANTLQPNVTNDISMYLNQLGSGELEPTSMKRGTLNLKPTSSYLERIIADGKGRIGVENSLLKGYLDEGNLTKFEEQLNKYKSEEVKITNAIYAQYIDIKLNAGHVNEILTLINELKENDPDFFVFPDTLVKVTTFLIESNQVSDAISYLEKSKRTEVPEEDRGILAGWWKLLNLLAKAGRVDDLYNLFGSLVENNHMRVSGMVLAPLIRVHLINNDTQTAVDAFEKFSKEYNAAPYKKGLFKHLMDSEDLLNLQKVVDINSLVHGEHSSLLALSLAAIECGRLEQARRIFKMPAFNFNRSEMSYWIDNYVENGKIEYLENLFKATQGFHRIDRTDIWYGLLNVYCRKGLTEKALELWDKGQEEGIALSAEFPIELASYLKTQKKQPAYRQSERVEDFLKEWTQNVDMITADNDRRQLNNKFPRYAFIEVLEKHPELFPQCEALAAKYVEKQCLLPINLIWCHYILTKNEDGANKIWTQYLQTATEIHYRIILDKAFQNQDTAVIKDLIQYLKLSKIPKTRLNGAYNALIKIHGLKGEFDQSLSAIDEIAKNGLIVTVTVGMLKHIKAGLEAAGKKFPYEIGEIRRNGKEE